MGQFVVCMTYFVRTKTQVHVSMRHQLEAAEPHASASPSGCLFSCVNVLSLGSLRFVALYYKRSLTAESSLALMA
jgi:hypothetical protein